MADPDGLDAHAMPLDHLLRRTAARVPDRVAIRTPAAEVTFAELDAAVTRFATALRARISAAGSVVVVGSVLDPEFAVAYYGAVRSGNVALALSPLLREGDLAHVLAASGAAVAVLGEDAATRVAALPALPAGYTGTIRFGGPADDAASVAGLVAAGETSRGGADGADPDGADIDGADLHGADLDGADLDAVACLHFTSGTTGPAKGVRLTHRNLSVNAFQVVDAHALSDDAITLNHLPSYHPMHLNSAVLAGATQVLCPAPDPVAAVELAGSHGVTHYYSLPVRLGRLAVDPGLAGLGMPAVRVIASGGSALSPEHARALRERFGVPVVQGYGLAETSPLVLSDRPSRPRPGSVGQVVAGTECRVVDVERRVPVAAGENGEVQVRGPQVMRGYLGAPDGDGVGADGWLSTGDVGRLDGDGYLHLVDRLKDVFKRDNWLVSPSALERGLLAHAGVRECVVVDLPHEFSGAVAAAFLVPEPGWAGRETEILAQVNAAVPYYQAIEVVEVVDAVPRSAAGKVQRRALRDRMAATHAADRSHPRQETAHMITFITTFTVTGEPEEFERRFAEHSAFMAAQPGFLSFETVRSLRRPEVYVNVGRWQDADAHRAVTQSPEFREHIAAMAPIVTVDADLYRPVASSDGA